MPETVHRVTVQIRAPSGSNDLGQVSEGFYVMDGNELTMTRPDGTPVDDTLYRVRVPPDADPEPIARVLTKTIRRALQGLTETAEAFERPIRYPDQGFA